MERYTAIPAPPSKNGSRRLAESTSASSSQQGSSRRLVESGSSGSSAMAEQKYSEKVPSDRTNLPLSHLTTKRTSTAKAEVKDFDGIDSDLAKIRAISAHSTPRRESKSMHGESEKKKSMVEKKASIFGAGPSDDLEDEVDDPQSPRTRDSARKSIFSLKNNLRERLRQSTIKSPIPMLESFNRRSTVGSDNESMLCIGILNAKSRAQQPKPINQLDADLDLLYAATAQKPAENQDKGKGSESPKGLFKGKTRATVRIAPDLNRSWALDDMLGGGSIPISPKADGKQKGIQAKEKNTRPSAMGSQDKQSGPLQSSRSQRISQKPSEAPLGQFSRAKKPRATIVATRLNQENHGVDHSRPGRGKQSFNLGNMKKQRTRERDFRMSKSKSVVEKNLETVINFDEIQGLKHAYRDFEASNIINIAKELNMPVEDIRMAKTYWDRVVREVGGTVSIKAFKDSLAEMLSHKYERHITSEMLRATFFDKDPESVLTFDEFTNWFSAHSFVEDFLLSNETRHLRNLSRKHEMSLVEVERIKNQFDHGDHDGSGHIDYEEFHRVLFDVLKVPRHLEMPESRVNQFWKEIDEDASGEVDFEEFLAWYIRYFRSEGSTTADGANPIDNFYKSIRPVACAMDSI